MLKNYSCGICDTKADQISHHKSHLRTKKHKIMKIFKMLFFILLYYLLILSKKSRKDIILSKKIFFLKFYNNLQN